MSRPGLLLVANWDSNVGYAWWLMESYWVKLAEAYCHSHDIHLCYPTISTIPDSIQQAPINVHQLDFNQTDHRSVTAQCAFLRKQRIQCIYFSDQPALHLRYFRFRMAGIRTIISHDHTPGLRTVPTGLKRTVKTVMMRLPFITVDAIFGATRFVQARTINVTRFPPSRTYSVPNGIRIPTQSPAAANLEQLFGIPRDRIVLVMTGRAVRYKGIPFALHCVEKLIRDHGADKLHFLFCGDGPHLQDFHQEIEARGISANVTMPGRRGDIPELLAACHFAMHPSKGEVGYSLSILEYMAAGLPVVVPDNPSVCEATVDGETGLIYRENDEDSACAALFRCFHDTELRQKMAGNARRRVADHYTLQSTHAALLKAADSVYPGVSGVTSTREI